MGWRRNEWNERVERSKWKEEKIFVVKVNYVKEESMRACFCEFSMEG